MFQASFFCGWIGSHARSGFVFFHQPFGSRYQPVILESSVDPLGFRSVTSSESGTLKYEPSGLVRRFVTVPSY
jgi:hypothetical protein